MVALNDAVHHLLLAISDDAIPDPGAAREILQRVVGAQKAVNELIVGQLPGDAPPSQGEAENA